MGTQTARQHTRARFRPFQELCVCILRGLIVGGCELAAGASIQATRRGCGGRGGHGGSTSDGQGSARP
jgi:hypothetical protein